MKLRTFRVSSILRLRGSGVGMKVKSKHTEKLA